MKFELPDLARIPHIASQFLVELGHRKIFAFEAEMGTGKTTFILGLLKAMGIENPEGSPTYSLINTYNSPMYGKVNHLDLYRLRSEEEAYDIGIEELLYSNNEICFIEWAEKIESLLPMNTVFVKMHLQEDGSRLIEVKLPE
ncbi:MAG TPA: tRNA (adenosine(37)-N6)-threonylcarbamoyltransferase complex ATPase subunit type 1 TsaE [Taishania sp.]|nr:tRNA (adenosine(37)-N6)-threonylcarbamoyltransferase complex ATPase subunit type 1 TsaE [Taishania sp.]